MQNIDNDTIKKAATGDMEAFEAIYRVASGYVYTVALKVTRNSEDAEEVTQDVFLSIYKNLAKFQFRSSIKTWIYRITTNKAINAYRKRAKDNGKKVVFNDEVDLGEVNTAKASTLDNEDNKRMVNSMLESLPVEQRVCVVLKDIEGLKYEEIAKTLKVNINTVRSRLKRAREKLISQYGGKGQES